MQESHLQRDFKEKDVQRLRNLITEKYGDKTVTQVGHEKDNVIHNEGDIWEEAGKKWTIKNGFKQSYTKLDELKKALRMPLCCPACKKAMKHKLDEKFYSMYKECFDCRIKKETFKRIDGSYVDYSENIITNNMVSFIDEAAQFIEDYATASDDMFYTETGEKEIFTGGSLKNERVEEWKRELAEMKKTLAEKRSKNLTP